MRYYCPALAQTSTEQLQHLLTDAPLDALALEKARIRLLTQQTPASGVLLLDDTGLPKQGKAAVGVQYQY